jgi:hypothetical protein
MLPFKKSRQGGKMQVLFFIVGVVLIIVSIWGMIVVNSKNTEAWWYLIFLLGMWIVLIGYKKVRKNNPAKEKK